jgi:outer membrane murein-binding lipoprotein Lpp
LLSISNNIKQVMKKILSLVLTGVMLISCTDYDAQFDQLSQQIEELAAANAALEAQLLGMQALNAQVAQQTAAKLAGFEAQVGQITAALTAIVGGLNDLGTANQQIGALIQALAAQVQAVTAQIAAITANIETLSGDNDALTALLNALAEQIATLEEQIAQVSEQVEQIWHHSGAGEHYGGGSESVHNSGSSGEEAASTTSYLPAYTGAFGGYIVADNVHTFPGTAEGWAGVANENADIYPLSFDNGGTITFTASSAGADVGIYFRFEKNPYPDVEPSFNTEIVTISGSTAKEYTITIDAQTAGNTYRSALLYLNTRDVAVTITDITITVPN